MLCFTNPGILHDESLTVMGLNAKETEDAIGFFGTGLKYAIAILLRNGARLFIQPGDGTEHEVTKEPAVFRGKDFEFLFYKGTQLPFTTELGKNWEPWQAYRELICNAWDERGDADILYRHPTPTEGEVRFIIKSDLFETIHREQRKYFWSDRPTCHSDFELQLSYETPGAIFYRGVLVGQTIRPALYSFNILDQISISEDRTLTQAGYSEVRNIVSSNIRISENPDLIEECLLRDEDTFEGALSWYIFTGDKEGRPTYYTTAERLFRSHPNKVAKPIFQFFDRLDQESRLFNDLPMTEDELRIKDKVINILASQGLNITQFNVQWKVDFGADSQELYGICREKRIAIGDRAWQDGLNGVLATAIEECIHAQYGYADFTRQFQDFTIRKLAQALAKGA